MTSRERLFAAMHLEPVDRVPVAPFGLGSLDPEGAAAQRLIQETDPFLTSGSGGDPFLGTAVSVHRETAGDTTRTRIPCPGGDLVREVRRTEITSATVRFPFQTLDDAERFQALPYTMPEPDLGAFFELKARIGDEAMVMVGIPDAVCLPASWYSPEGFCLAWADDPGAVTELTALASRRVLAYVEQLCREGVDAFRIIGGEYASVQLGPKGFDALVMPFDTELVDLLHRHNAIAYYHNHGPVTDFLDRFAALGVDAVDPFEAPPWGDIDLAAAHRRIGDRVCLVGNLDDMEVLGKVGRQEVETLAAKHLEEVGDRGFILGGTASGTYDEYAAENFIAMAQVSRRLAASTSHQQGGA